MIKAYRNMSEKVIAAKDEAIAAKNEAIAAKDEAIAAKKQAIAAVDQAMAAKDEALVAKSMDVVSFMGCFDQRRRLFGTHHFCAIAPCQSHQEDGNTYCSTPTI